MVDRGQPGRDTFTSPGAAPDFSIEISVALVPASALSRNAANTSEWDTLPWRCSFTATSATLGQHRSNSGITDSPASGPPAVVSDALSRAIAT